MRARLAIVLSFLLVFLAAVPAHAATVTLAQETETQSEGEGLVGEEEAAEQSEGGNESDGVGQSDADAETGASEEQQEGGESTEEEGPPWTYQMARIGLVLMLIVGLLMGLLYYRMIASRQRAA